MSKVAFIGARDAVLAFKALGVLAMPVSGSGEALQALRKCVEDQCEIVFLTEPLALDLADEMPAFASLARPVVTIVPDHRGTTGVGRARLKKQVEKAIGVDILFKEEGR
ncbi:MAG: V-type ATP synthase subunit F [Bacillota bacterium]